MTAPARKPGWPANVLVVLRLCCALALAVLGGADPARARDGAGTLEIHVTDLGADHWEDWLKSGDAGVQWLVDEPGTARIPLPLPAGALVSSTALADRLSAAIDRARTKGSNVFEVQIIEDLRASDAYMPSALDEAEAGGRIAYSAVRTLAARLVRQKVPVHFHLVASGTGAAVFGASAPEWAPQGHSLWQSVAIFDSQARLDQMDALIRAAEPRDVRIFDVQGAWLAKSAPMSMRSISNPAASALLKDRFPELRTFVLHPTGSAPQLANFPGPSHSFLLEERLGRGSGIAVHPQPMTARELVGSRPISATPLNLLPVTAGDPGMVLPRMVLQDLLNGIQQSGWQASPKSGRERAAVLGMVAPQLIFQLANDFRRDQANTPANSPWVNLSQGTMLDIAHFALQTINTLVGDEGPWGLYAKRLDTDEALLRGIIQLQKDHGPSPEVASRIAELYTGIWKLSVSEAVKTAIKARAAGLERFSAASGTAGRLTLDTYVDARMALVQSKLLWFDALPDLASTIVLQLQSHDKFSPEILAGYTNAALKVSASWTTYLVMASLPYLGVGEGGLVAVGILAPGVRDLLYQEGQFTLDMVGFYAHDIWAANFLKAERLQLEAEYQTYVDRQIANHQPVKSMKDLFGFTALNELGLTLEEMNRAGYDQADRIRTPSAAPGRTPAGKPATAPSLALAEPAGDPRKRPPFSDQKPPPCVPASVCADGNVAGAGPGGSGKSRGAAGAARLTANSQALGGVDPDAAGHTWHVDHMPHVDAVVVDPTSGRLVVLSTGRREHYVPVDQDNLMLALWAVYSNAHVAFSLDPEDPAHPDSGKLRAVYLPAQIAGLEPARAMADGDVALKLEGFGLQRKDTSLVDRVPSGPFPSYRQMLEKTGGNSAAQWSRFWIVAEDIELAGNAGVVDVRKARMAVRARRQIPDPGQPTGLRDVDTDASALEARWSQEATRYYDDIARKDAPDWSAIRELSIALQVAHWLKNSGVTVDLSALARQLDAHRKPHWTHMDAVDFTTRHSTEEAFEEGGRKGKRIRTTELHLFGGVDPEPGWRFSQDAGLDALREVTLHAMHQHPGGAVFELQSGAQHWMAAVLDLPLHVP